MVIYALTAEGRALLDVVLFVGCADEAEESRRCLTRPHSFRSASLDR